MKIEWTYMTATSSWTNGFEWLKELDVIHSKAHKLFAPIAKNFLKKGEIFWMKTPQ